VRRIYVCIGIFAVIIAYAVVCEIYVANTVRQTTELLGNAAESRSNGDYSAAGEYVDSAREKWCGLTRQRGFILANLTMIPEVAVSLSRVSTLAHSPNSDDTARFFEEYKATIQMLEHFLLENLCS